LLDGAILPGGVERLTNICNIRVETGAPIQFTSPDLLEFAGEPPPPIPPGGLRRKCTFVPVTFDADVVMNTALVGAVTNGRVSPQVAGTNIAGWAQLNIGCVASAAEILKLMGMLGPAGASGTLGCIVNVGTSDTGCSAVCAERFLDQCRGHQCHDRGPRPRDPPPASPLL
jgi:hypothetical protein